MRGEAERAYVCGDGENGLYGENSVRGFGVKKRTCGLVVGTGGLAGLNSAGILTGNFGREKREMQKVSVNFPFSDTVFNAGAVY